MCELSAAVSYLAASQCTQPCTTVSALRQQFTCRHLYAAELPALAKSALWNLDSSWHVEHQLLGALQTLVVCLQQPSHLSPRVSRPWLSRPSVLAPADSLQRHGWGLALLTELPGLHKWWRTAWQRSSAGSWARKRPSSLQGWTPLVRPPEQAPSSAGLYASTSGECACRAVRAEGYCTSYWNSCAARQA